jgi:Cu-processing system permease protein
MNSVMIIARNTFKEIIRDRILYGLLVFAVLFILFSLVLGQLSFAEQQRISLSFGFAGIHVCAIILALFVGSTLVAKEIEKQTILTLLARPLSRTSFLVGKYFGMLATIFCVVAALGLLLLSISLALDWRAQAVFFWAIWGTMLECFIVLALVIFFGTWTKPALAVSFVLGLVLVGHWLGDLDFFARKSENATFLLLNSVVQAVVPRLESFNWRSEVIYSESLTLGSIVKATGYSFLWSVIILSGAHFIFRRKDFA